MMNYEKLREFAHSAQFMIDHGEAEDKLRHFFSVSLPTLFPDLPWWVQAQALGAEEHVRFTTAQGVEHSGFVDTVIGKTAVEYEKNLKRQAIFEEGHHQVKEYCAALANKGIPENEILGVLSDTVRWRGYTVQIVGSPDMQYGPDDVELTEVARVDLSVGSEAEYRRFETFTERFFNRDESRLLNAITLSMDFGVDSSFYQAHIGALEEAISQAMAQKPDYADLIKRVWQNFVAYLGASNYGEFSLKTYVNEFYLVTVAKAICVNILSQASITSDPDQIKQILSGAYFVARDITNFVDYDYFGWLNNEPYADNFVDFVSDMQRSMVAYDFSHISDKDLFGRLLAELANKEHRLMLGQEFTPYWIAREMVEHIVTSLGPRHPRALDMCCGSGVFLIETIKATRAKYHIVPEDYSEEKDTLVFSCATGFDIDPLAVMLAKVNWVIAMQDLFCVHHGDITIPVYHADSLFVDTPIIYRQPGAEDESYALCFDGNEVTLPGFLFSADKKRFFDAFMAKVYRLSMVRASEEREQPLSDPVINALLASVEDDSEILLHPDERARLAPSTERLINELERLQRQGRNGIWYFILCNSYRPGLTRHQFNCIVSNPPWMAMSKLANNPYKQALGGIADRYAIKPTGASRPHMELATIFLLNAVDRYLGNGALWSCIMPGSLLSGYQHNKFRQQKYRTSAAALSMDVAYIWEIPPMTFKNKAVILSGAKMEHFVPRDWFFGRVYDEHGEYTECTYRLIRYGVRTAWTNSDDTLDTKTVGRSRVVFQEGADLLPRTVLFHEATICPNRNWTLRPIERTNNLGYLTNESKIRPCCELFAENVSAEFMYDAYISKHVSPFFVTRPAKVMIPGKREEGKWRPLSSEERALVNAGTESVFAQIEAGMGMCLADFFVRKVNKRRKLDKQDFDGGDWLVLSGAGGSNPCAAYLSLAEVDKKRTLVDQTLYWHLAQSEAEALYITGMINSRALAEAISEFQPEGGFGARHIHGLPYGRIPRYDKDDPIHTEIAEKTRVLVGEWLTLCKSVEAGRYLDPNSGSLNRRRRRQQELIRTLSSYDEYEIACKKLFK